MDTMFRWRSNTCGCEKDLNHISRQREFLKARQELRNDGIGPIRRAFTCSVASLAALRGKRLRKYSETDASCERLSGSIKSEGRSSQLYTKVPLTPLAVDDNEDYNFKRQASVRIKKMTSCHDGSSLFPKLNDCAHFHYDHVELGAVQISMHEESDDRTIVEQNGGAVDLLDCPFTLKMQSQGKVWLLKRCYEDFRVLDKQLHKCIYDRRFSQLVELPKGETLTGREAVKTMLTHYVTRFSQIAGDMINCGPVLNWLEIDNIGCHIELDNHGNHVVASEESAINIPAVAAAHVIKRYAAQAPDEISLEVGDMISVIDMPPPEDTSWWRGKNKFDVGFFPRQCVEIISEKLPLAVAERVPKGPKPGWQLCNMTVADKVSKGPKPVLRKHGKLITFLRSFILERPTRRRLKQSGILKERVFGCDLGEHLLNTGTDVPSVVQDCCHFIEQYGIVDGIYRLSGVASNVQYLRDQFDSETTPNLDEYKKDIHCMSSVCKLYFRELPNPLLTYQLYKKFEEAAMSGEENRLMKMHDTVQQLPPPHYRTLQFLIRHLSYMSSFKSETSMNIKNLAIVWAPNLLRSKDIETGSCAAFMEIKVQATVVEYLVKHCDLIFNDKLFPDVPGVSHEMARPKSLVLSTPTKLLSLEEARARSSSQGNDSADKDDKPKFIEVGGGPAALPKQYHTVIDLPPESRKRFSASKAKKSPGWKAFFSKSTGKEVKRKMSHDPASLRVPPSKHFGSRAHRTSLRSVKSAESLSSAESASELQGQEKYGNILDPRFKGHMRRSSVACMENNLRRSSSDSFFEVDADIVAAATREMLAERRGENPYSGDEIFIEEESGATCQLGRRRGSGTNSPLWIDQSLSSMESDQASLRSPYGHQPSMQIGRKMSAENNWQVGNDDIHMACDVNVHHYHEETPPPSPTEASSPERYQCTIAEPVAVPQRHPLKTSIAMPVAAAFTPEYRDVEMTESGCSSTSPDHTGSVLDKISRAMSIKTKAKLKRESSTEADDYSSLGRSPDTGVDDVMDRPIMVTVRTQTSPHDTLDDMDTGEEVRKYDVNLQTSGSDGAVFMRTPAQRRSMNLDLFSGLDEALLGTTAPRPKSIHVSSHLGRGSESYDDDFAAFTTRLSLDNVLSEYDHILAKYNNRPLTPDFDRNDDMCKYDGMYPGQRISSPRHGITPVTALNSNCNNTRQRRLQHRYSMGDEMRAERFNNRYSTVLTENGETRKRLSAGAVLDHHTPGQENDEEVVVVRLRRPRPPSAQKKLYTSPERFSINSPEFQASFADQQNGNTPPESASDLRTLKIDEGQRPISSVDAVYHVTLPTRPNSQQRGISKSFSLDFQSSIPDAMTRIGEGLGSGEIGNTVNEAEAGRSGMMVHEDDVRLDNQDVDGMQEIDDADCFAFQTSSQDASSGSPLIDRYPIIISDELEL
ncbi:rho GTPase-activating protein 32-like isoform X2 [Strongylocentrotus purpuratus]|uniref:Uncharacterized protein n=1 Tax=Strongylocentrotus purpuratus TaxID=7668 RepID=A0A7M7NBN6_STRPU|nr:rho GTPase-activating protein 32-like isoform X2 [Strongylocentrotus purpuratus]